ncbi:MAG: DUF4296 domain-containing protein [Sodaliphilus sp.]
MKSRLFIIASLVVALLCGCDKAPNGVIKESDFADFLYDLYRLEAIIESNPDMFPTDSVKRVAKQSLFQKHGITQADYDSSMVWYAANFQAYSTVHKKVVMRLQEDKAQLTKELIKAPQDHKQASGTGQQRKMYATKGDTADIWTDTRSLMLSPGLKCGYFTFECQPDGEHLKGDKYTLSMKMLCFSNTFSLMLAAEYQDGSVAIVHRNASMEGWSNIPLQTDSTRNVRRIFGYIKYNITGVSTVNYLDSIALLRTHLDRGTYPNINSQKFISKQLNSPPAKLNPKPIAGGPREVATAPRKLYTPKPGVNKSGVVRRLKPPQ